MLDARSQLAAFSGLSQNEATQALQRLSSSPSISIENSPPSQSSNALQSFSDIYTWVNALNIFSCTFHPLVEGVGVGARHQRLLPFSTMIQSVTEKLRDNFDNKLSDTVSDFLFITIGAGNLQSFFSLVNNLSVVFPTSELETLKLKIASLIELETTKLQLPGTPLYPSVLNKKLPSTNKLLQISNNLQSYLSIGSGFDYENLTDDQILQDLASKKANFTNQKDSELSDLFNDFQSTGNAFKSTDTRISASRKINEQLPEIDHAYNVGILFIGKEGMLTELYEVFGL